MKFLVFVASLSLIMINSVAVGAQNSPTDTPIGVNFPTQSPPTSELQLLTPTPTFAPTEEVALLEAAVPLADINVRSEPDVAGARLGTLEGGRQYPVRGRYFSWFLFDYESSATGQAWVFGDLVNIIGDASTIPAVDPSAGPTPDQVQVDQTATAEAIAANPELAGTATAEARALVLPTEIGTESASVDGFLPTFTPPAEVVPLREENDSQPSGSDNSDDILEQTLDVITSGSLPPIVPIGILGGVGLFGLLISLLRRR